MSNIIRTNADVEEFGEIYLGKVEDIMDPKYEGRCRIRVFSLFDDIPVEDLPWAVPANKPMFFGKHARGGSLSIPKVGAVVQVRFNHGDIYSPEYHQPQEVGEDIKEELKKGGNKYEGAHFILFDGDEEIKFWFDREIGLQMEMKGSFIRIDQATSNIHIEHKETQSLIALENNIIRINANSQVNITTGTGVKIDSPLVDVSGGAVKLGKDGGQYSAVCGEPLQALLTALAVQIDAKLPGGAGTAQSAVNTMITNVLSQDVKVFRGF